MITGADGAPLPAAPTERRSGGMPPGPSGPHPQSPRQEAVAAAAADAARQAGEIGAHVDLVTTAFDRIKKSELHADATAVQRLQTEVTTEREQLLADVVSWERDRSRDLSAALISEAERIAPGMASAPWDAGNTDVPIAPADAVRIGTITIGRSTVPGLLPVSHGWAVDGAAVRDVLESTVLRLLAQTPLHHLQIVHFDPSISGLLSRLLPLRQAVPTAFPSSIHETGSLTTRLAVALSDVAANRETVGAQGGTSLVDLWRSGHPTGRFTIIVVSDYPYGIDAAANEALARLAAVGPAGGVFLLVERSRVHKPADRVDPTVLLRRLLPVSVESGYATTPSWPAPLAVDPPAGIDEIRSILRTAGDAAAANQGPVVPLESILAEDLARPWRHSSLHSIDALIGRSTTRELTVSLRTANPPHPNLLIGGAVGQGKSNLLLAIIYSLAVRYPPDELEFILLDFKRGLEFTRFDARADGTGWLPHATYLSLESDLDFGLALLRHVVDQMTQRVALFKSVAVSDFDGYRIRSGEGLPRLVLVIDEFHELFHGDDGGHEATALLESLARLGRAHGIHVILSSQTVSGIGALATKADAIFSQFPIRMSLKNTVGESQAILSPENRAAAQLTYRGEIVLNTNYGHDPEGSNTIGISAHVDTDRFSDVQLDLWRRGHGNRPQVFIGSSFATPPSNSHDDWTLRLGLPIAIGTEPVSVRLTDDVDQSVVVLGTDERLVAAVLVAALRSVSATTAVVTILNGLGDDLPPTFDLLSTAGPATALVVPRSKIRDHLLTMTSQRSDHEGPELVIALALQRVPELGTPDPAAPDDDIVIEFSAYPPTPRDRLCDLATNGAVGGRFLIGWWPSGSAADRDLGYGRPGTMATVLAGAGPDDHHSVGGPFARPPTSYPRIVVAQRTQPNAVTAVPFDPEGAW